MRIKLACVLPCLLGMAGPSIGHAERLNFGFSFTNFGSPVSGVILGLENNATSRAQSVQITSAPFGIGEYVSDFDAPPNSFTVSDRVLTAFSFVSFGRFNDPPAVTCCTLLMSGPASLAALWDAPEENRDVPVFDFVVTRLVGGPPPAPVPVPTPIPMLVTALAGLGWLGRPATARGPLANRRQRASGRWRTGQ
jgi:hypothetical protein